MSRAKCPHCGSMQTDLDEYWPLNRGAEGWTEKTECGSCSEPIVVICRVRVDYWIEKPNGK